MVYKPSFRISVYTDAAGEYRWRARAANGRIVADSGEGYKSLRKMQQALRLLHENAETFKYAALIHKAMVRPGDGTEDPQPVGFGEDLDD